MKKAYKIIALLVFMACCAKAFPQSFYDSQIATNWKEYDLGDIKIGTKDTCKLVIQNISDISFDINYILPGCQCISYSIDNEKLSPGSMATITIFFNSFGKTEGLVNHALTIYTSTKKTYNFRIKANLYK